MTEIKSSPLIDVDALYRRYGPMVLRRCRRLLRDQEAAADAMQETFVRVLRNRTTLVARYPSSLLYRIATNVCLNVIRTHRRKPTTSVEPLMEVLAGSPSDEDRIVDASVLEQIFSDVKEGTRRAAEMHFLEEATLAETARNIGLSVSGVRKRLRSLRTKSLALMTN